MRKTLLRMTLRQLQVFRAVCDHGSYSRAADEMALTQPAVSNALRRLREQAGDIIAVTGIEELGISEITTARPIMAALTSALTFAVGAMMPLAMVWLAPANQLVWLVSAASLLFLALLGAIGAKAGGADVLKATIRVTFWGAFAMALTAGIGALVGTAV